MYTWQHIFYVFVAVFVLHAACTRLLIVQNAQYCLLPGGTYPTKDGDKIIPVINSIRAKFDGSFSEVAHAQQSHCKNHVSFASSYIGALPGQNVTLSYNSAGFLCKSPEVQLPYAVDCEAEDIEKTVVQQLRADHCVAETADANPANTLFWKPKDVLVHVGTECDVDNESAFAEGTLIQMNDTIDTVFLVGIGVEALAQTAIESAKHFTTYLITDAVTGHDATTTAAAMEAMKEAGVKMITTSDLNVVIDPSYTPPFLGVHVPPWWQAILLFIAVVVAIALIVFFTVFHKVKHSARAEKQNLRDDEIVLEAH